LRSPEASPYTEDLLSITAVHPIRTLSAAEQAAVDELSCHIDVTSTRAWGKYHWGDFKHDPKQALVRYFDAFLYYYYANWGCQRLAFRFPKGLLDEGLLQPYLWEYCRVHSQ